MNLTRKSTQVLRVLARRIPIARHFMAKRELRKRFPTEHALLRGENPSDSEKNSVLHFSVNKAATQHVKQVLFRLAEENNMLPVALHDLAFNSHIPYMTSISVENSRPYQRLFIPNGYIYSVFSGMIDWIPDQANYRTLITVRDPRDILVSEYYSQAYSHAVPPVTSSKRDRFLEGRKTALEQDIDSYVLSRMTACESTFASLASGAQRNSSNPPGILRYEEMIANYESWLNNLIGITGLSVSETFRKSLILENLKLRKLMDNRESPSSHHRKGKQGDYKEKLRGDTIVKLNIFLEERLRDFGYEND